MTSSPTSIDIDKIVAAVLQRLGHAAPQPRGATSPSLPSGAAPAADRPTPTATTNSVRLDCRVLSLEQLRGVARQAQTIEIDPRCVVTPAAMDEIRQRKQRLVRRSPSVLDRGATGAVLLMSGRDEAIELPPGIEHLIASRDAAGDAQRITAHINGGGQVAVWWTHTPFAAALQLAGRRGVQMAQLASLADWPRAVREVRPNALILDRAHWSPADVAGLLRQCTAAPGRTAP
ncbi:MAG: hypothetical protein D6753_05850 [Planctomycetota bacterium]|nr:MAG: hypothetical protein D6753_05850 [Planctomycetota bacterium]